MKKNLFSLRCICSIILVISWSSFDADHSRAEDQCAGGVCFSWAFGAIKGDEGEQKFIEILSVPSEYELLNNLREEKT